MPNEALISQIENILSQVVDIGGQQEITSIVTNLEVVDASPTGLTGFITVKDDRDGDTILAKTVPGLEYTAADFVNVLFINGTEPIAFQQGSNSSSSNSLWSVQPSTNNIFYTNGDVGVGINAPTVRLHVFDSAAPVIIQRESANTSAVQQTLVLSRSTTGTMADGAGSRIGFQCADDAGTLTTIVHIDSIADDVSAGVMDSSLRFRTKSNNTFANQMIIDPSGNVGIKEQTPLAQLHIDQTGMADAEPVLLLDQADADEPFVKYIGEAAAATLTRSIVAEADVTTATRAGFVMIEIEDIGNQVTDQDYFVAFYTLA